MTGTYHHGDLRDAIMTETLAMIREDQVHLIGFREIARRLGVSRSAPYRHFKDLNDLYVCVTINGFHLFIKALRATEKRVRQAPQCLSELGKTYVNFAIEHPAHYRLMFEPRYFRMSGSDEVTQLGAQAFAILKQGVKRSLTRTQDSQTVDETATLAWACVHGMAMLIIDQQIFDRPEAQDFVSRSCDRLLALIQPAHRQSLKRRSV